MKKHYCKHSDCDEVGRVFINMYGKDTGIGNNAWVCHNHFKIFVLNMYEVVTSGKT